MTAKKVSLVAGGAGFIGRRLCEKLLEQNRHVVCVDIFFSSRPSNLKTLKKNPNFSFIKRDVTKSIALNGKIDEIWNLASPASPIHYQKNPIFTITTNFLGAKNLLDLAVKKKAKFLQASTSEIYGDPLAHPQKETYWGNVNPIGPRSCYDEGKRAAESLCADYKRVAKLDVKIIRIFNTYGPGMLPNDGRVVSNFIIQALSGKPLTVYGNGTQTRSFCYVDDLVEGMIKMMAGSLFGPVNFGNPNERSILEIAKLIIKLTGSQSKIIFKPLPQDDPEKRKPDIALAESKLNWHPRTDLEAGLKKTIDFFRISL